MSAQRLAAPLLTPAHRLSMARHAATTVFVCAMVSTRSAADTIVDMDGAVRGFTHVEWHPSTRIMRRSHMGVTNDPEHTVLAVGKARHHYRSPCRRR